jgi:predicted  nucleic acid-binding Zn ribbon protein
VNRPEICGILKEELATLQPFLKCCDVDTMTGMINAIADRICIKNVDPSTWRQGYYVTYKCPWCAGRLYEKDKYCSCPDCKEEISWAETEKEKEQT